MKITLAVAAGTIAYKIGKDYINNRAESIMDHSFIIDQPENFPNMDAIPKFDYDVSANYFTGGDDAYKQLINGINHHADITSLDPERTRNCTFCSAAIIARLKGYNVTAAPVVNGLGYTTSTVENYYYGDFSTDIVQFQTPKITNPKQFEQYLIDQGDGHYGTMHINLKLGPFHKAGHSIVYTIKNGHVEYLDGQLEQRLENDFLLRHIDIKSTEVLDLTNVPLCDPWITRCIAP
jgi:hypothetical protein